MRIEEPRIRTQLDRLLQSRTLAASDSLRRLLRYLGEKTLAGEADQLKEYAIGIDVLGKPPTYDPREDSTVRHQIGRLRHKISEYYQEEGRLDEVSVTLPKGSFRLDFARREVDNVQQVRQQARGWRKAALVLAALFVCTVVARVAVAMRSQASQLWTSDLEDLWAPILGSSRPTVICVGTPLFVRFPLAGYFRDHLLNEWEDVERSPKIASLWQTLGGPPVTPWTNFTGAGEAHAVFHVARLLGARKANLSLVRSSALSWDQIASHDIIFIGPPKFNLQLKEVRVEHDLILDVQGIHNLRPQPGEPELLGMQQTLDRPADGETHALISVMPGVGGSGAIIVLAGNTGPDTLAAAEWMTQPGAGAELARRLRAAGGQIPRYYQAVLKVRYRNLFPVETSYVLHHVLTPRDR